ncbi:MAG TPA: enoyl-CoA hydratase/isomerase family protein [Solirubrobacterales bacterium]|nr:enoyl-CoA hydratase/isomerase family protein [Solirubrobacterales bacterium]
MEEAASRTLHDRQGPVTVIRMVSGENRLHPEMLAELETILDELEAGDEPAALVLTGSGKFFSNGLDLDYMSANPDDSDRTLARVHRLFARLLALEVPAIAAINGHAFAAGAMLALCFDQAVMREDRGWFCLPEADIGLAFTPGMNALIRARLSPSVAHEAMVLARRYSGSEAQAAGIVAGLAPEEQVLGSAVDRAEALAGKPRHAIAAIKRDLYAGALEPLTAASATATAP